MGYGLIDSDFEDDISLVCFGVLSAPQKSTLPQRLHEIYTQLLEVIDRWKPSVLAIEDPFVARNPKTALAVGQAQGVAFVAAAHYDMEVSSYPPRLVKQAMTSHGGSAKEQVQEMVRIYLGLDFLPEPLDAADSLAVAICHTRYAQQRDLIARSQETW